MFKNKTANMLTQKKTLKQGTPPTLSKQLYLRMSAKIKKLELGMVAHICNHSYLGSDNQEDYGLKPVQTKLVRFHLNK
jgi:hypothetical protein